MSTARSSTFYATRGLSGISHSRQLRGETKLHYREQVSSEKSNLKEKLAAREVIQQLKPAPIPEEESEVFKSEPQIKIEVQPGLEEYYFPEDADDGIGLVTKEEEESEDEDEMLMRELARIKEERAAVEARKRAEEEANNDRIKQEEIAHANPLMSNVLKRQWFQDTVFSNTTSTQPKVKKAYVNDPIRNEFHKKFINKYIG
jgi:hypothetical protein